MSDGEVHTGASGLARKRRWAVGIATGAVLLSGAGMAATQLIKSPAQAAADSEAPPPTVLTAPVEHRVLEDSVTVRGTVTADQTVEVSPSAGSPDGGPPVVTKLPVEGGQQIEAGQRLLEVSGRPVFALQGELPVFRDLKPGAEGDDIAQLQDALTALGHSTAGDRGGYFGPRTKAALTAFYDSIGYTPQPAQADGDSAVDSAESAVTEAERALEDARSAAASGAGSGTPGAGTGEGTDVDDKDADEPSVSDGKGAGEGSARQIERAQEDLAKAREELARVQATTGPMLPASEVVFLSRFPARVDEVHARVGDEVSGPVLTVSAGALVVHGYLQQHEKGLVRSGQQVRILSEVTGRTATAKVVSVADTVGQEQTAASGEDKAQAVGAQGYLMLVRPDKPLPPDLTGQDVRLTVHAAATKAAGLVVPLSAVSAGADGRTTVTVVEKGDGRRRVAVVTGSTGDGCVEVRPQTAGALAEGDNVLIGVRASPADAAGAGS
ncbi:peptidoglycan-binding protein [Streptomyces sp. NPDC096048]|uniref:peptidoglycan-binding protein n=1 Tax=Streptomyces sp. NPDC096048 TaxID=3366072 RepID=UPI0037F19AC9